MTCPQCAQQFEQPGEQGQCPFCGYPCAEYQRRITQMQVVLAAIFLSTLIYAGLAAALELTGALRPLMPSVPQTPLAAALLGVAVGLVIVSGFVERTVLATATADAVQRAALILAAVAEAPAVFGLVIFLLTGSLVWMAAFIGVSWLLFLRLGLRLPVYLHRISEYLKPKNGRQSGMGNRG